MGIFRELSWRMRLPGCTLLRRRCGFIRQTRLCSVYLSPEVEWTLIALDEHWRERRRVVFRKRSGDLDCLESG